MNTMKRTKALLLTLAVLAIGAVAEARVSITIEKTNGKMRYQWSSLMSSLSVELDGKVTFNADDTDVVDLSPGGRLVISERSGISRKKLTVERGKGGELEYVFRRGGRTVAFDEDGRDWFAGILPRIIRESGVGAEARVARILEEDGVDGVFDEIELIESSGASRIYCTELLEQGNLDTRGLRRLARAAAEGIASSGERSGFLISAADRYLEGSDAFDAYFDATASIPSSGDHARALLHAIEERHADTPAELEALLRSARGIPSSGDKSRVLITAADAYVEDDRVRPAYFDAVNAIPSSGDHARVLTTLLSRGQLTSSSMTAVFESAREIASSGDKARVLVAAATRVKDDAVVDAYLSAVETIASSGDQKRALSALVR